MDRDKIIELNSFLPRTTKKISQTRRQTKTSPFMSHKNKLLVENPHINTSSRPNNFPPKNLTNSPTKTEKFLFQIKLSKSKRQTKYFDDAEIDFLSDLKFQNKSHKTATKPNHNLKPIKTCDYCFKKSISSGKISALT
jgi:hypothetical protein